MPPPWPKDKNSFRTTELLPYWTYALDQDFHSTSTPTNPATYAAHHPQTWNTDELDKLTFAQPVQSLSTNSNSTLIAFAIGSEIRIHAASDRRETHVLKGHTGDVETVAWSPTDPKVLVSCGQVRGRDGDDDGPESRVLVWNVDELAQCGRLDEVGIRKLASQAILNLDQDILELGPEGGWTLSSGDRDTLTSDLTASLTRLHARYLVRSNTQLSGRILEPRGSTSTAFSPDGKHLLFLPGTDQWRTGDWTLCVLDLSTRQPRVELRGHTDSITWAAFSPNGQLVGSASFDGSFRIWDASTGASKHVFEPPNKPQNWTAGFSPDGTLFAGTSGSGYFYVWSLETGNLVSSFEFGRGKHGRTWCRVLAWSPDSKYLAVSGQAMCTVMVVSPLSQRVFQERRLSTSACEEAVHSFMPGCLETTQMEFIAGDGNGDGDSDGNNGNGNNEVGEPRLAFKMSIDRGLEVYDFASNEKKRYAPPAGEEGNEKEEEEEIYSDNMGWGGFVFCPREGMLASVDGAVVRFWKV